MAKYGMGLDASRCVGCQTCVVACQQEHNTRPGVAWSHVDAVELGEAWPEVDRLYLSHGCMHCENAPCVEACPTQATTQREDGIVVVDYDACIGCGVCAAACPFDARTIVGEDVRHFGASEAAPYEAYGIQRINCAEKCTFCAERVDAGLEPRCVDACFFGARLFGDLDDPESPISAVVAQGDAEQIPGTSVYYVKHTYDLNALEAVQNAVAARKDGE